MNPPRVLVIGSANADLVTRVPRCPRPGESLVGQAFTTVPGGKGANQAVAAARLGAATTFVGTVGDDALGGMLRAALDGHGVDIAHCRVAQGAASGTAVIFVADDGQNSIVVTPAANLAMRAADVQAIEAVIKQADVLLVQLEIDLEAVAEALTIARKHNVLTITDAGPAQQLPDAIMQAADILSPNETEAETITGIAVNGLDSARAAAISLQERGARDIVLKLGSSGSYYRAVDGREHFAPAFAVEAVDTVAAGDAYTAALALRWRAGVEEAMRYANAAGALATTKPGAQDAMPTSEEVETLLKEYS